MSMDKFKNNLKIRLILLSAISIGIIIFIIMQVLFPVEANHPESFMLGVRMGGVAGSISVISFNIIRYIIALTNKSRLQKMFITENDERKKHIEYKCGKFTAEFMIYILCVSIIVSTFFNMIVFWTLYIVMIILAIVMIGAKIYFNKKY